MRFTVTAALCCAALCWVAAGESRAQPPKRSPDIYAPVAKVVPATDAEKKDGTLAWVTLKGSDLRVQITTTTKVRIQKGRLEDAGKAEDVKVGDVVSIWHGGSAETDPPKTIAEFIIIFRAGQPDLPPAPGK
jgi:hypothetical protein